MKALVILFSSDREITPGTDAMLRKALLNDSLDIEVHQTIQLSDEDVVKSLMQHVPVASTSTVNAIHVIANTIPLESEVKAAGKYLIENFGDPDDEDSFRIRVQIAVRSGSNSISSDYTRLMNAIEIFSKLHNKKLSVLVNTYLRDTGLVFMKSFANSLIRMKDM